MKDSYTLTIKASDKGVPAQTSSKTLLLRVGDINDNAPEFSYDRLAVKVSETAIKGTVVMTLKVKFLVYSCLDLLLNLGRVAVVLNLFSLWSSKISRQILWTGVGLLSEIEINSTRNCY